MAEHTRITAFTEVIEHILHNTLVVLDIDETMLRLPNDVGTKHWWASIFSEKLELLGDHDAADAAAFEHWRTIANNCDAEHTDQDGLDKLLKEAREVGNNIIAVTARSPIMRKATERHLESIGVEMTAVEIPQSVCYNRGGVFYVGDGSKADVIMSICEYLRNSGAQIRRVVFIDDVESHVQKVADALDCSDMVGHCYVATMP
jgi:hypothetical protein